jgi:hypothetical protein
MAESSENQASVIAVAAASQAAQTAAVAAAKAASVAESASVAAATMGTDIGYIKRDIGEIKAAIKDMGSTFVTESTHSEVVSVQKDHEDRIRSIEKYVWIAIGALYILNAVVGFYLIIKSNQHV